MIRLLFATTYGHLPDVVGGLQTTIDELCTTLKEKDVEVRVLCGFAGTRTKTAHFPRSDCALGYSVVRMPDPVAALPTVCAAFDPDALLVQSGQPTIPMLLAALDLEIPTALYQHNVEYQSLGGVLLPDPQLLYLANSRFTAARMRALFGIEVEELLPLVRPDRYRVETSREKVLFINPTLPKGVEIAFKIAARMPDVSFRIAESWKLGDAWQEHCQRRAESLGNIEWVGQVRDMTDLYRSARVLLMPSVWEETYGRSAAEVQISGIPVLASNRGGLPETIGDGGVLIDPHAPISEWVNALQRMFDDEEFYQGLCQQALHHAARQKVDPDYIVDHLLALLEGHIRRKQGDSH